MTAGGMTPDGKPPDGVRHDQRTPDGMAAQPVTTYMTESCSLPFCRGCGHGHVLRKLTVPGRIDSSDSFVQRWVRGEHGGEA